MDLIDDELIMKKTASKTIKRLGIISLILLLTVLLMTYLSYLDLKRNPARPIDTYRSIAMFIIIVQLFLVLLRNISIHRFFMGILLFIPKAFLLLIVGLIIFIGTPGMSFFGIQITDMYAIVISATIISLTKLFVS